MPHLELPSFPRGFLLSEHPVEAPPTYIPGPVLPNFYVHPWTNVRVAGNRSLFVILLGHCVPISDHHSDAPVDRLYEALSQSESQFLYALNEYSGRHAVIFGSIGDIKVVNDAIGMRSIFYAAQGGVVASHAALVEAALAGRVDISTMPFQYGFPGNRTPYARTKLLTANTYYWLTAKIIRRFWPIVRIEARGVDDAAAEVLEGSAAALRRIAMGQPVRLTLTAGLDSRAILAIALYSGVPFQTYTYGDNRLTDVDRAIARALAQTFKLRHTEIDTRLENKGLTKRLREVNYMEHHMPWVEPLMKYYPSPHSVAVLGNALEIGRSNTVSSRRYRNLIPVSAEAMANLHYRRVGVAKREAIKTYGRDSYMEVSRCAFQSFIDETSYGHATTFLNPFDLFYWEHRMSAWQAHAMNERDFYGESFIPFNSRRLFEAMLGVPEAERYEDAIVYRIIEMVAPRLLDLPINPTTWPAS